MVSRSWNWKLSHYVWDSFNRKENCFFQRKKSPVMTWEQVKDPSRLSTLSTLSFTSVPFQGQKFTVRFSKRNPRSGLTSFNRRFAFFPKPNHMSPVPKQDQSDQHLVCHHQTHCSQAFESHPEMRERKCFCASVRKGTVLLWGNLTSLEDNAKGLCAMPG